MGEAHIDGPVVLVTGPDSLLGRAIFDACSSTTTTTTSTSTSSRRLLGARSATTEQILSSLNLLQGVDSIVYIDPVLLTDGAEVQNDWLDSSTRLCYDLLSAAAEAGVRRCICLSSLAVFDKLDVELAPQPFWQPRPTPDPAVLGPYLSEFVARQFAFTGVLEVVIARVAAGSRRWHSDHADVARAIAKILQVNEHAGGSWKLRYSIEHLATRVTPSADANADFQKPSPVIRDEEGSRVLVLGAKGLLGPDVAVAMGSAPMDWDILLSDITQTPDKRDSLQNERFQTRNAGQPGAADPVKATADFRSIELDAADLSAVRASAAECDVLCFLAVVREHPRLTWEVNCRGTYNAVLAAVENGHSRFVNTGPVSILYSRRAHEI